jgi:NAD(P)-dependent dehydrogenase (short-subunit alcohol dehydrogenase family)
MTSSEARPTLEVSDRVHSVTIRAVFVGVKHRIISMLRAGGGAIVNVSSTARDPEQGEEAAAHTAMSARQ